MKEVMTLRGHRRQICAVAFQPGGGRLASGGDDKTIRIEDVSELAAKRKANPQPAKRFFRELFRRFCVVLVREGAAADRSIFHILAP